MGLIAQAKKDIEKITSNSNEWAVSMTFIAPDSKTATINGIHSKHHLGVDTDGNMVSSKKAHVSFSEKFLLDANYQVRNLTGEVSLINHRVSVKDSTGEIKNYIISSSFPDETIGLICCILEDYE